MSKKKKLILINCLLALAMATNAQQSDFPKLSGPYLGQKLPGNVPELFAPGIVSRDGYFEHSAAIFSPEGDEVYWAGKPDGTRYFEINFMKMINGKWTEPKIAFSHKEKKLW